MEGVEAKTMTEIGWLKRLNQEPSFPEVARCRSEDLAGRVGHHQGSLRRKHVGNDVASRLTGAGGRHQSEILEGVSKPQAIPRGQDEALATATQESPLLDAVHPARITVDAGSEDADEPAEGCSEEAGQDVGKLRQCRVVRATSVYAFPGGLRTSGLATIAVVHN